MIMRTQLENGKNAYGVFSGGYLLKLLQNEELDRGDLIDVFGGTIQLVIENSADVHSFVNGEVKRKVTTLTANDRRVVERIDYEIINRKIVNIAKRPCDVSIPLEAQYAQEYWTAISAA